MLSFHDYKKQFGSQTIISTPMLELGHGIYWLKGQNGSGKTTLLKSISGLIPFDGRIAVDGKDIRADRVAYTRIVNYAEAEPLYPGFLTGRDLIELYTDTKTATKAQVQGLIDAFGIASYAGNSISTYSSGMAKKLSLVLGFMGNPKLILLDEPLITLDQQALETLQSLVLQYYANGVTFLITSHQEITFGSTSPTRLLIKDKILVKDV
jgi:ABC-2 type transport system ATP-binding protein